MTRRAALALGSLLLPWTACAGASSDPGLHAWLRVEGAQFEPGALPEPNGGPELRSARVAHQELQIGTQRERVTGALDPRANAVAIARAGDAGFWIVTAGLPSVDEPELPTFSATLGLSRETPAGPFALLLSAVDRQGRFGERAEIELVAERAGAEGELVVSLSWDTQADLDVHVLEPSGVEIWARNINAFEPPRPGQPPADPNAWRGHGILDFDSNAQCVNDGRSEENVRWAEDPEPGAYTVRVATASLCGEPWAHWSVEVWVRGEVVAAARGTSVETDVRAGSGAGAGIVALEFDVP